MQLYFYQQAREVADDVLKQSKERISKQAIAEYHEKIEQHQRIVTSGWVKFFRWLLDGVSGIVASFVIVFIIGGISFLFLGQEARTQMGVTIGNTIIRMINPELPLVDEIRKNASDK